MNIKLLSMILMLGVNMVSNVTPEKVSTVNNKEITISFIGDCTLGTYKGQSGNTLFTHYYDKYGADYFFENVKEVFESDDITYINLEGPLTTYTQTAVKQFPIKGNPEYVDILKNSSIEVCNMANNHIYDCGQDGFLDNVKNLDENNIGYCGEGYIYNTTKNDIKVSCLGYRAFLVDNVLKDTIKKDIERERSKGSDIICIMFHYGVEREYYSNSVQEDISRYAIDCGADIVVGNHPHVIQGIEKYKDKIICYSLGNFCFGANKNPKDKDTFIFQQTFVKEKNGVISYGKSNIIPCSISSQTDLNDYKPTPLIESDAERILNRLKEYSSKYTSTLLDLQ